MRLVFFFLFLFIHLAVVGLRYITGRGGGVLFCCGAQTLELCCAGLFAPRSVGS